MNNKSDMFKDREIDTVETRIITDVICDSCGDDYTHSDLEGGLLFGSSAYCPKCEPRIRASAKQYNEESYIKAVAMPGQTFRSFVVDTLRGGKPGKIVVTTYK